MTPFVCFRAVRWTLSLSRPAGFEPAVYRGIQHGNTSLNSLTCMVIFCGGEEFVVKSKGGRPRKEVDGKLLLGLAEIGCTDKEISTLVECSVDTLTRRFADILDKGRESLKMRLRRAQWKAAVGGNPAMLIWLGKQYLAQSDKAELKIDVKQLDSDLERELALIAAGGKATLTGEAESEAVH